MNNHADGLVGNQNVAIFKEDVEGNRLGLYVELWREMELNFYLITEADFVLLFDGVTIEQNIVLIDQILKIGARVFGVMTSEQLV